MKIKIKIKIKKHQNMWASRITQEVKIKSNEKYTTTHICELINRLFLPPT